MLLVFCSTSVDVRQLLSINQLIGERIFGSLKR